MFSPYPSRFLPLPSPTPMPHLGPDKVVFVLRSLHREGEFVCALDDETRTSHLIVFTHSHEAYGYLRAASTSDNRRLAEWADVEAKRVGDLPLHHVLFWVEPLKKLVPRRFTPVQARPDDGPAHYQTKGGSRA